MLEYKGYFGTIKVDAEAGILHGDVLNIRDVITFEGKTVDEAREAFVESVDDYLALCKELNRKPENSLSGKFLLRDSPEFYRLVWTAAKKQEMSLNAWAINVLAERA